MHFLNEANSQNCTVLLDFIGSWAFLDNLRMEAKEEYIPVFLIDNNIVVADIDIGAEWCGILFGPVWLSNHC
jgi:hypothetical protein